MLSTIKIKDVPFFPLFIGPPGNKYQAEIMFLSCSESRLDSGLKLEGGTSELNSKIKLDFAKLSPSINSFQKQDITFFMELISSSAHQSLLKHPLSEVS